jgi:GNAT superfamily N-acetyltransferase
MDTAGPTVATGGIRQATRADSAELWRIRHAVTENTLTPGYIDDEDLRREIEDTGRGWVAEEGGQIVGFAIGNARTGNIWALFIDPAHQGQGHGTRLHDTMVAWLWDQGLARLWLTTGSDTRARAFYERRGWQDCGAANRVEHRYELRRDGGPGLRVAGVRGGDKLPG